MGSPVSMVRKKKTIIDTFPKWLDDYMTYMLVLVHAYPRRTLELIKYQQIISRAVANFKGLAWLSYDQQFRRRAAYYLWLSWDKVVLELWKVTFAGLAKPYGNVCSSPYHAEDDCPSADLNRKSLSPRLCTSTSTSPLAAGAETVANPTCVAAAIPVPTPPRNVPSRSPAAPTRPQDPATVAKSKVEQQRYNHKPVVSCPIDIYRLELELASHPDRNFVYNLLSTQEGARIGYTGPRSDRVFPNLISAAQHPDVVSLNLQKEVALERVAGPYPSPPLPKFQCLPVGVIPK